MKKPTRKKRQKVAPTAAPWTVDKHNTVRGADGHPLSDLLRDRAERRANALLQSAAPELLEACSADWDDLWQFFNWFASGKSQEQWSRAEPLAVLGEVYRRLAIINCRRMGAIKKAKGGRKC